MTRRLLAPVKTTTRSAELKTVWEGWKRKKKKEKKESCPVMEACGGAAKGLRFDRKGVRTTPPGLGPMGEEICGKTIELWNPSLHVWL